MQYNEEAGSAGANNHYKPKMFYYLTFLQLDQSEE